MPTENHTDGLAKSSKALKKGWAFFRHILSIRGLLDWLGWKQAVGTVLIAIGTAIYGVTERLIPDSRVFIIPGGWEGPARGSLPFPFSSKRGEGRLVDARSGTNEERRQRTAGGRRPGFRGLQLRNRSGWSWTGLMFLRSKCDAGTFREGEIM